MTDQLILKELRALSASFKQHAADTERRLDNLETQMERLLDPDLEGRSKPARSRRALPQ